MFLSAEPKHWCSQPGLDEAAPDLNWTHRIHLGSPIDREDEGYRLYSRCKMYKVDNWTDVFHVSFIFNNQCHFLLIFARRIEVLLTQFHSFKIILALQNNGGAWPEQPDQSWEVVDCQHGWKYDTSEFRDTLVTELDLVCDDSWWPSTSTALFYVGSLIGNILFGQIADRWEDENYFNVSIRNYW